VTKMVAPGLMSWLNDYERRVKASGWVEWWVCGSCGKPAHHPMASSPRCPRCGRQGAWAINRLYHPEHCLVTAEERPL